MNETGGIELPESEAWSLPPWGAALLKVKADDRKLHDITQQVHYLKAIVLA